MNKNEQLDKLFKEWIATHPDLYHRDHLPRPYFVYDGIINEAKFEAQKERILFICKEPNDPDPDGSWDFRHWWQKEIKHSFSHRIAEWAYFLLEWSEGRNPSFQGTHYAKKREALQSIAFMNLRKTGGYGTADWGEITRHVNKTRDFLRDQILIIDPTLIVTCFPGDAYGDAWPALFEDYPSIKWAHSGYEENKIGRWNDKCRILEFVHPSARYPKAMMFAYLARIVSGRHFRNI